MKFRIIAGDQLIFRKLLPLQVCAALLNETGEPLAQLAGLARRFRAAEATAACAPVDYEAPL